MSGTYFRAVAFISAGTPYYALANRIKLHSYCIPPPHTQADHKINKKHPMRGVFYSWRSGKILRRTPYNKIQGLLGNFCHFFPDMSLVVQPQVVLCPRILVLCKDFAKFYFLDNKVITNPESRRAFLTALEEFQNAL